MNRRLPLVAGLLAYSYIACCQTKPPGFFLRRYVAHVRQEGKAVETGVLFELTDSTILLAPIRNLKPTLKALIEQHGGTLPPTDSLTLILPLRTYRYSQINRLILHRRGHGGKGFLIGAGIGALAGLISGDDEPGFFILSAGDKAFLGAISLSLPGLLIGAAMTKSVRANEKSVAAQAPGRFQKFTIVEQVKRHTLYLP